MPELPEVEIVCRALSKILKDRTISGVKLNRLNLRYPFPPRLVEQLTNQTVCNLWRRAKYIVMEFVNNPNCLIIHLGMSGNFRIMAAADFKEQPHDHVVLTTDNQQQIIYNDPRRFGFMDLVKKNELTGSGYFKNWGLEPFDEDLTAVIFHKLLRGKNQEIKQTLLCQRHLVGVGNIYASESLWASGINPLQISKNLTVNEACKLLTNIRIILQNAIEAGGSTLRDHRAPDGKPGNFQNSFKVYGRKNLPCLRPKCPGYIQRQNQGGRASYFCNTCQPPYW